MILWLILPVNINFRFAWLLEQAGYGKEQVSFACFDWIKLALMRIHTYFYIRISARESLLYVTAILKIYIRFQQKSEPPKRAKFYIQSHSVLVMACGGHDDLTSLVLRFTWCTIHGCETSHCVVASIESRWMDRWQRYGGSREANDAMGRPTW